MKYVIHGATGAQGSPLFHKLLKGGKGAVAAVRDTTTVPDAPAVAADYASIDSLVAAYDGAAGVFLHLPLSPEGIRLQYARNIGKAIGISKPKRVLVSTSGAVIDEPGTSLQAPENSAISTLIRELETTGVSMAVVAPRLFLENLLLPIVIGPAESAGILPYPLGKHYAVSWSSHLDVADVTAELFAKTSVTGIVGVGQQPAITGDALAVGFSKYLGGQVVFESLPPEEFGKLLAPLFGQGAAAGVAALYRALQQTSTNAIRAQTSAQQLLGITPRTVERWLSDVGA